MEVTKVGVREFRAHLTDYLAAREPITITRHGQTVGFFIPAHGRGEAALAGLRHAARALDALLEANQVDVDEVVQAFRAARREKTDGRQGPYPGRKHPDHAVWTEAAKGSREDFLAVMNQVPDVPPASGDEASG